MKMIRPETDDMATVVGRPVVSLTAQQEAQIRQLGQSFGVDPDMLVQALRSVQIRDRAEGRPGLMWENPPQGEEATRARDLASAILQESIAHAEGYSLRSGRNPPDFSPAALARAIVNYTRQRPDFYERRGFPARVSRGTEAALRRQAEQRGVDPDALVESFTAYRFLSPLGNEVADAALREISGGDQSLENLVRANARSSRTRTRGGETEYWIASRDLPEIRRDYARLMRPMAPRAIPARVAARGGPATRDRMREGERLVREQVREWRGNYATVMRNIRDLERGADRTSLTDRNGQIALAIFDTMQRHDITSSDLNRWTGVSAESRRFFRRELPLMYG